MRDVKHTVAENLAKLRKEKGLTQAELAEKLNYSDKAISRWEHGDTLPDINVLCDLCDYYGITLDMLVGNLGEITVSTPKKRDDIIGYKLWMCALSVAVSFLFSTIVFVYLQSFSNINYWQSFIWAVSLSALLVNYMSKGLPNRPLISFICESVFFWSLISAVYCHFLSFNFWMLFLLGIPIECVVVIWWKIKQIK